jgi:hypothetical protein
MQESRTEQGPSKREQEPVQESTSALEPPLPRVKKPFDLSLAEELAYLAMKRVFGEGIKIPIRKEGLADFDVIIKEREVMIDFNELPGDAPQLTVWRFTFAFQGEPLAIYGRGVKRDLKIFPLRVTRFLVKAWMSKRRRRKELERQEADRQAALQ